MPVVNVSTAQHDQPPSHERLGLDLIVMPAVAKVLLMRTRPACGDHGRRGAPIAAIAWCSHCLQCVGTTDWQPTSDVAGLVRGLRGPYGGDLLRTHACGYSFVATRLRVVIGTQSDFDKAFAAADASLWNNSLLVAAGCEMDDAVVCAPGCVGVAARAAAVSYFHMQRFGTLPELRVA